jgi:hypothetical protein
MKQGMVARISIFAVVAGVGWKLASPSEASATLRDVSLIEGSEHSQPGPSNALAGVRIRLSPSDFGYEINATAHEVPQIALTAE